MSIRELLARIRDLEVGYEITWYEGTIEKIEKVLKRDYVFGHYYIDEVKWINMLPEEIRTNLNYVRSIVLEEDEEIVIDYGSHTQFIKVRLMDDEEWGEDRNDN